MTHLGRQVLDRVQDLGRMPVQQPALLRQAYRPDGTIEQLRPEAPFQRGDLLGRGGLRDAEQLRRRRHLAGLGHGDKDLDGLDEVAVGDGS